MMDKSLKIQFHFQGTVPVLKCKHGSPVKPECGIKYFLIENIFNLLIIKIFILCHEELHDLHTAFLAEIEFSVCMCIFSAIYRCSAKRVVRIMLIEPVVFVKYRNSRCFDGWNASEKIPETFEMVFHLSSATHYVSAGRIIDSVTGASGDIHCLQNMDMRSRHLCITNKETCCCK